MPDASPVTVVVVSYNTREKLRRCLSCIEPEHEVIVVDNASADGSPEMVQTDFPHVRLIRNAENRGFGAANNQGIDSMTRELALFLNSDCYAEPGAIAHLAEAFAPGDVAEESRVVGVGGMLLNPDKTLQDSVAKALTLSFVLREQLLLDKFFGGNWITGTFARAHGLSGKPLFPAPQIMGACLMIKPLERFDQRFFLYVEDTDLCKRLSRHGILAWVPGAVFIHELGSSSKDSWLAIARYNYGKELYFRIHHGRFQALVCFMLNRFGALLRLLGWLGATVVTLGMVERFRKQVGVFARVLFDRGQGRHASEKRPS